uniref:Uncharacterized protein n=1 Tax=Anguilla anguilla TaxID=7936 RepID=A0A0E9QKH2_ANGAN
MVWRPLPTCYATVQTDPFPPK